MTSCLALKGFRSPKTEETARLMLDGLSNVSLDATSRLIAEMLSAFNSSVLGEYAATGQRSSPRSCGREVANDRRAYPNRGADAPDPRPDRRRHVDVDKAGEGSRMIDLLSELRHAADGVRQPHLDRLKALGVSLGWLADCDVYPFGISRCEPAGEGLYQMGDGALHLIIPVLEDGVLVDLCAVRSDDPSNWLLRTGNGWALGVEKGIGPYVWYAPASVDGAGNVRHQVGKPTHIFSDPLDWLQGRGEGICILDWSAAEVRYLDVLSEVVCSDHGTAVLLERALTRPTRLPKISIMEAARVA